MDELIARIERATGPSLDLDGRIWCAVNGYEFAHWDGAGCAYYFREGKTSGIRHAPARQIKPFSASLDAALTLVPDGWIWDVASTGSAWTDNGLREGRHQMAKAATPALALVIAALKARQ